MAKLMNRLLLLIQIITFFLSAHAAPGPLRILYLGKEGTAATQHAHVLMREFGRDAIWFDYTGNPAQVIPEWLARFDAVLLDAPRADFSALTNVEARRIVTPDFANDDKPWNSAESLQTIRGELLAAAGETRRREWESFLARREPEQREPNPNIANYERRPHPITFQHPFSIKGSTERTQTPIDMRLELFASEPDISKPIAFAWDGRGRLWVCETRDYPHGVNPSGEGNDTITICEDTDGDGRADKFT